MNRVDAEQIDPQILGVQPDDAEALAQDLLGEPRAPECARAGIEEHVLADQPVRRADGHFQRWRARLAADARNAHPVFTLLLDLGAREIDHDVGRDVVGRIVHLVEHLLEHGHAADRAAGAGDLGDHRAAIGCHLGDREGEVPGLRHVLVAGIGKIASGHLRAAFEQMADARTRAEMRRIVLVPAELDHHRGKKERRIGDPPGDHHLGAGL